jgi:hypothetical protein
MMSLRDDAARLAVLRVLLDRLTAEVEQTRGQVWRGLLAARAEHGLRSAVVELPDGTRLGTVTITQPKTRVEIEPAGFLAWAKLHHPGEVVEVVRDPFRRAVLAGLRPVDGEVVWPPTGDFVPWARLVPAAEPTSFAYRPSDDAVDAIVAAYRAGQLSASLLPSIEAPEGVSDGAPQ